MSALDPELLALLDAYQDETLDADGCRRLLVRLRGDQAAALALVGELRLRREIAEALREREGIDLPRAVRAEIGVVRGESTMIRRRVIGRIHRRRRRRHWPVGLAAAAGLLLGLALLWRGADAHSAGETAVSDIAQVTFSDGLRLRPGQELRPEGPQLLTQSDGSSLQVDDGVLVLEEAGERWRWSLQEGHIEARVEPGSDFAVRTPHGLVSVRGTRFSLQSSPSGTLLGVSRGAVHLQASEGGGALDCGAGEVAMLLAAEQGPVLRRWRPPASEILHIDCRFGGRDPLRAIRLKQQVAAGVLAEQGEIVRCGGRGLPLLNDRYVFTDPLPATAVEAIREAGGLSFVMRSTVTYPQGLALHMMPLLQFHHDGRGQGPMPLSTVAFGLMPNGRPHTILIAVDRAGAGICWIDGRRIDLQRNWPLKIDDWREPRMVLAWLLGDRPELAYLGKATRVLHGFELHAGLLSWDDLSATR